MATLRILSAAELRPWFNPDTKHCPTCDKPGRYELDTKGAVVVHPGRRWPCRVGQSLTELADLTRVA